MTVALLLPDGVGTRNFLTGPFRRDAKDSLSLTILTAMPESVRRIYENETPGAQETLAPIEWTKYQEYRDTASLFVLRNVLTYAHMYSIETFGMKCLRNRPLRGIAKRRMAAQAARTLGYAAAKLDGLRWLDRRLASRVRRLPETARYRSLFERTRPTVLLSSNQRPYGVLPAVLAAQSLGIPTATCIFSWDNLTSKGRIAAPFDHYLVWGSLMKHELQTFYPEIPPERIHVVGALQFDLHADTSLLKSREQFFREIGADPGRPLLCYSAGDPSVNPEDQGHVELLLNLIRQGRIVRNPQVVLRPTPTVDGKRFDDVRRRFPELIYSKPEWVSENLAAWAQSVPLPSDLALLANLAHHSDMNVSVASTMTLDFAIHNRPIVNIAFDLADPPPFKFPLWDYYYQFEHYRPVVETGAALFSRSADEFVAHINRYLDDPSLHTENRRRLIERELDVPVGEAGRYMVNALLEIGKDQQISVPVAATAGQAGTSRAMLARDRV